MTHHLLTLGQDLRLAFRIPRREPWFAAVAIGTVAIGIGLTSAVFSVGKALLVDPLPYQEADRAVMVWVSNPRQGFDRDVTSYPRLLDWREQSRLIESFAAYTLRRGVITDAGDAEQLLLARVTPEFFDVLRTTPMAGRVFSAGELQSDVVILSHGLWQRKFGGDPSVIGRAMRLDAIPYTVIGVLPETFRFPERELDAWVPLQPGPNERSQRGNFWLNAVARLESGVSIAQAQNEMSAIAARLAARDVDDRDLGVVLVGLRDEIAAPFRSSIVMLAAAVVGVLLIACVNVAGMLIARGGARRREVAVRTALGAARRRIARQLLTEAVVLFMSGGVLGVLFGTLILRALAVAAPPQLSWVQDVTLDVSMMLVAMTMTLVTGVVFGVLPSWTAAGADVTEVLGGGEKGTTRGAISQRFRGVLVVSQVGVATIVVSASCLLIRSLVEVQRVDLGLDSRQVLTARVDLPRARYLEPAARRQFFDRLLARVRALPGVTAVGAGTSVLLSNLPNSASFTPEGWSEMVQEPLTSDAITREFFQVLRVPLVRGRFFTDADRPDGQPVAILNETAARKYWPNADPIGKRFKFGQPQGQAPWLTIVGVVADTRRAGVDHPGFSESYQPFGQASRLGLTLLIRTAAEPEAVTASVRAAVREIDPDQPLTRVSTLEEAFDERTSARRFNTWLLSAFGVAAVVLMAIGLYSLLAYVVVLRQHEMAVRLAIGATPSHLLSLVVRNMSVIVGGGVALGLGGAFLVAQSLRGLLFGVQPADPLSFVAALLLLVVVVVVAAWVPVRRALRVDPAAVLRSS